MLESLKRTVLEANLDLKKKGLVVYTWGNVSGINRETGLVVIKPSGVAYDIMTADHMVVVDLDGNIVEGECRPSSDTDTHLALYRAYPELGGVVHTHSTFATAWAQSCREIPSYGTTQADYFYGSVPCTRLLTKEEVEGSYELETGMVIIESLQERKIKPLEVPGIVVSSHGPFTWGKDADDAVHNAVVLEEVAKMAFLTEVLKSGVSPIQEYLQDKHYLRKHGCNAYYGQK